MKIIDGEKYYKISEIIEKTKMNKSTIHYYKGLGLIPEPLVMNKNMIYYKEITINCLNLIKYLNENEKYQIEHIKKIFDKYEIDFSNKSDLILKTIEIINNGVYEYIFNIENENIDRLIELNILNKKEKYTYKEIEIINIYKELKKYDIKDKLICAYIEQGLILAKLEKEIVNEVLSDVENITEILIFDILTKLKGFILNKQILKIFNGE